MTDKGWFVLLGALTGFYAGCVEIGASKWVLGIIFAVIMGIITGKRLWRL